jgi:lipopolysaccharide export system permease protein
MTLRIEESYNDGKSLRGIFVRGENKDGQTVSATASRGQFLATDDPNTIILRLSQGVLIHESPKFAVPRVLTFDNHDLPIPLPKIEAFRLRGGADRELTIPELFVVGKDKTEPLKTRLESRANFHFRIVEVMSMFLVPLIAISLAIPPKRSTSALGVFLSIVMLVTQHKINQYAEDLGARGVIDPLLALWVPFLLFAGLAIWMYYTLAHVPGGQPIGALERVAAKAGARIRGLIRIFQRKQQTA